MNAYFISGLGADKRIFSRINLDQRINIIHLDWIQPTKNESLENYAKRLGLGIDTTKSFAMVGVSFGGMIATELAKVYKPRATIAISSTIESRYLPAYYRFAGKLNLIKIIPASILKASNKLTQNYFFGVNSIEERKLLSRIVEDTDAKFLKWAIGSILGWKNKVTPNNLYHIHGTNDKILYSKTAKPNFVVKNGTHFMVYQNAEEISNLINDIILKS